MQSHPFKSIQTYFQKDISVYVHEIAFDIHLQYICLASMIHGNRTDMMLKSPYPIMCPSPFDATVTVCNERPLEQNVSIIVIQMMDNPARKSAANISLTLGSVIIKQLHGRGGYLRDMSSSRSEISSSSRFLSNFNTYAFLRFFRRPYRTCLLGKEG